MTTKEETYRWNTLEAAEVFDRAAEHIHPLYLAIQDEVIRQLPISADQPFLLVDLGAGSGRLVERILQKLPRSRAVLVDQSEPFLTIAKRRLAPFEERAVLVKKRLQEDWHLDLPANPQAIVSMSAIHHLDSGEKRALFGQCHDVLSAGGRFINGDEYRPESDEEYLAALEWWNEQKEKAEEGGLIPASFRSVFEAWYDRNVRRFGEPKRSGDDCHESIAVQADYLKHSGFARIKATYAEKLWAVLVAEKP